MKPRSAAVLAFLLLISTSLRARQEDDKRKRIDLHTYYRHAGWIMTPATADDPNAAEPTLTHSVVQSLLQAVEPETGQPYQGTVDPPTCKPSDLRIAFRLEKKEFLLGEPLLVEFRVELDGPGYYEWSIGGNSRTLGRDDTFSFLMRNHDGTVVPDPYEKPKFYMGGLTFQHEVKKGAPVASWLAIQRWCAIDRPGTYDLYCVSANYQQVVIGERQARVAALPQNLKREVYIDKNANLMDVRTNKASERYELVLHPETLGQPESPLREYLPADIPAAMNLVPGSIAHFTITIRNGTDSENAEMVDRWTSLVEPVSARAVNMLGARRPDAALEAIWYARQNLFLPSLAKWIADPALSQVPYLDGVAMRPDPAVVPVLLQAAPARTVRAFWQLNPVAIPSAIPKCIEWLTDEQGQVRAAAEFLLVKWTGRSFDHDWEGYSDQRPTVEEGQKIQLRWQEWWEQNRSSFRP